MSGPDYKNSDVWGNTTPENFKEMVPEGAWITRDECQEIISFFNMPIAIFDVGQDAEWESWVSGSTGGHIPGGMLSKLRGPTGKGYKSGCLAPFLAWTWAWHGEYVESTSFLSLIGGMFLDTAEGSAVIGDNLLFAKAIVHLDALSVARTVTSLWLAASLERAGLLRIDVFIKSDLWNRSPALYGHVKTAFSLAGDPKMSSITIEQYSTRGFLAALKSDLPWLLACTLGYLLVVKDGNAVDQYHAGKLRQQFEGKQAAMDVLDDLLTEVAFSRG